MKKQILSAILIMAIVIGFISCKKEVVVSSPYQVGEYYHGGIIVYIDGTGQHGLISSNYTLNYSLPYSPCQYPTIENPKTNEGYGFGADNTLAIMSANQWITSSNYGASVALTNSLYSRNWFLPSKEELNIIYKNVSHTDIETDYIYQSSSLDSSLKVWVQDFKTGKQYSVNQWESEAIVSCSQF